MPLYVRSVKCFPSNLRCLRATYLNYHRNLAQGANNDGIGQQYLQKKKIFSVCFSIFLRACAPAEIVLFCSICVRSFVHRRVFSVAKRHP